MLQSTTSLLGSVLFAASATFVILAGGCTNTRYPDLMRVTAECDMTIAEQERIYTGTGPVAPRNSARDRIINLREKQMIMAQRINVKSMPEVASKAITVAEGEARKAELVKAATERYNAALALPIPVTK
jgi:hypothetical protein